MKKIILSWLTLTTLLTSTQSFALFGHIKDNRYYSKGERISVEVPHLMQEKTNDHFTDMLSVSFVSGGYYWMMDGAYYLDVMEFLATAKIQDGLYKALKPSMNLMFKGKAPSKLQFQCKYINSTNPYFHRKAYQCITRALIDNVPAMIVGTSQISKTHPFWVANTFALEPANKFHWARYQQFTNSVSIMPKSKCKKPTT